ncbi:uncharacterized protein LOC142335132 isoform X3 [Convolutriloba macropyga]|uniref:uncharacterized protein LOC142335132 isoform X3 n=1 Tax=Convolutriloba macropyga TaxID=536237 RepID=UPI003F520419
MSNKSGNGTSRHLNKTVHFATSGDAEETRKTRQISTITTSITSTESGRKNDGRTIASDIRPGDDMLSFEEREQHQRSGVSAETTTHNFPITDVHTIYRVDDRVRSRSEENLRTAEKQREQTQKDSGYSDTVETDDRYDIHGYHQDQFFEKPTAINDQKELKKDDVWLSQLERLLRETSDEWISRVVGEDGEGEGRTVGHPEVKGSDGNQTEHEHGKLGGEESSIIRRILSLDDHDNPNREQIGANGKQFGQNTSRSVEGDGPIKSTNEVTASLPKGEATGNNLFTSYMDNTIPTMSFLGEWRELTKGGNSLNPSEICSTASKCDNICRSLTESSLNNFCSNSKTSNSNRYCDKKQSCSCHITGTYLNDNSTTYSATIDECLKKLNGFQFSGNDQNCIDHNNNSSADDNDSNGSKINSNYSCFDISTSSFARETKDIDKMRRLKKSVEEMCVEWESRAAKTFQIDRMKIKANNIDLDRMSGGSDWKYGLCSPSSCTSDFKLCLFAYCIPTHVWGVTTEKLAHEQGDSYRFLTLALIPFAGLCLLPCWRKYVREKSDIGGSFLSDCCAAYCCPCCTILQAGHQAGMDGGFECTRTCDLLSKTFRGFSPKQTNSGEGRASTERTYLAEEIHRG